MKNENTETMQRYAVDFISEVDRGALLLWVLPFLKTYFIQATPLISGEGSRFFFAVKFVAMPYFHFHDILLHSG